MIDAVNKPRAEQLKELLLVLAEQIDRKPGARDMASLARQYRETLKEIEETEGVADDDEIGSILAECAADGESRAVRKSRTEI